MKKKTHCFSFISFTMAIITLTASSSSSLDYKEALSKSLLYFEAQRSGHLPYDQRVQWRDHSGLTDGLQQGVDLVGGYYDAGDHVKFGLPMAFTVTMLSWSVIEYRKEIESAGELRHALEAIKWGTDYFIKAHTHPNVLWAEVGDGGTDHYCWQRPEDMTTSRKAYKIDSENPGSDLAGEAAAAMAAASIVFRKINPHYSHLLLHHAQQLFEFGDKYRGNYDTSIGDVKSYYASVSGYRDELLWAALWLHKATGGGGEEEEETNKYLEYVVEKAHCFGGIGWAITEFSWDVKFAGVQVLAAKLLLKEERLSEEHKQVLKQYRSKAEHFVCACLSKNNNGSNVDRTPGGLLYIRQWNNMQYVSSAAFLLAVYSDYLSQSQLTMDCPDGPVGQEELLQLAKAQADYILGMNPMNMSYLVGYGEKYPLRVHHRAASLPAYKYDREFIGCTQGYDEWYGRRSPNPNVLVGAIVGGPDCQDRFKDVRGNYMQTEACTYNTAPMVGGFPFPPLLSISKLSPDPSLFLLQKIDLYLSNIFKSMHPFMPLPSFPLSMPSPVPCSQLYSSNPWFFIINNILRLLHKQLMVTLLLGLKTISRSITVVSSIKSYLMMVVVFSKDSDDVDSYLPLIMFASIAVFPLQRRWVLQSLFKETLTSFQVLKNAIMRSKQIISGYARKLTLAFISLPIPMQISAHLCSASGWISNQFTDIKPRSMVKKEIINDHKY